MPLTYTLLLWDSCYPSLNVFSLYLLFYSSINHNQRHDGLNGKIFMCLFSVQGFTLSISTEKSIQNVCYYLCCCVCICLILITEMSSCFKGEVGLNVWRIVLGDASNAYTWIQQKCNVIDDYIVILSIIDASKWLKAGLSHRPAVWYLCPTQMLFLPFHRSPP